MSELINNREMRKETLKSIMKQLHEGKTVEEVKQQFEETFHGVSAAEISEAEAALVMEGIQVEEIQKLCDVHASVFKGSIHDIHKKPEQPKLETGHPLDIFEKENRVIEQIMEKEIRPYLSNVEQAEDCEKLVKGMEHLSQIDVHYAKKENLLFPYLEKYEVTAPPKVMWGVDDEIRSQLKIIVTLLTKSFSETSVLVTMIRDVTSRIQEMIFKEEKILFPLLLEKLTLEEWLTISKDSKEYGYLMEQVPEWKPKEAKKEEHSEKASYQPGGEVVLPSGRFKIEELVAMLNTLPFDITFVDKNDQVKYFTEGKERIFARTRTIIERNVSNCHPPASVHIVEQIVADFKNGKKEHEDFWIQMGDKFVLIRYFAVRDKKGEYLGVLEVTQDIKPIQAITGEKRLVE